VIIPSAEALLEHGRPEKVGVLATEGAVNTFAFPREIQRQCPGCEVVQQAAPLLVPLIENDGVKYLGPVLDDYLRPLLENRIEALLLGCTHYCLIKELVRDRVRCQVLSQDEIVPEKLASYLARHPEIANSLGRHGARRFCVTDVTNAYLGMAERLSGSPLELEKVELG
jgi:glutamate racemase